MSQDLQGRVAIVTGGARGIGEAIVRQLASAGCDVVINCHKSVDEASTLAAQMRATGRGAEVVVGSVADPGTGQMLADCALRAFGRIDILVNNAGITRDATVRKMTDEAFTEVVETNLTGTHRVTKAVLDPMCEAGFGRIVSVSSFVGQIGNFGQSNYAASKGGLIAWTKTLAHELARYGITANCVCPGFIETDMLRGIPDDVRERLKARVPLGRFGDRDAVGRAVMYLVRDGDYVTGSCLNMNGGIHF